MTSAPYYAPNIEIVTSILLLMAGRSYVDIEANGWFEMSPEPYFIPSCLSKYIEKALQFCRAFTISHHRTNARQDGKVPRGETITPRPYPC